MNRFWIAATASLVAAPAMALDLHFYGGAGVAGTTIQSASLAEAAASEGVPVSGDLDDTGTGYQVYAGLMLNDNFGVELKYGDSGDGEADLAIVSAGTGEVLGRGDLSASIDGFTLYGVARQPIVDKLDLLLKAGWTFQDADLDVNLNADGESFSASASDDDDGLAIAGGLRYSFTDLIAISAELEYLSVDFQGALDEPYRASLNLELHFR